MGGDRERDFRLRVVKLALEGTPAPTIARALKARRMRVWRHLTVAERAGVIQRVSGAYRPVVFEPGPNASILIGGWPGRGAPLVSPPEDGGSKDHFNRTRIHAVNYRVKVLAQPDDGAADLPWSRAKPWGRVPSRICVLSLDDIGKVRLRLMGARTLILYTPSFMATKGEVQKLQDTLYIRVQAVLSILTRKYGYRFGEIRTNQAPEFAFPVDRDGVKRILGGLKPVSADGKWWVDASPESGGAEIETRDQVEALKYLAIPERLERIENLVAKVVRHQQETDSNVERQQAVLEKVVGLIGSIQRHAEESGEATSIALERMTYLLKELGDRIDRKAPGPSDN